MKKDKLVSLAGLTLTLGFTLGVLLSPVVTPAEITQIPIKEVHTPTYTANVMDTAMSRATLFEGFESEVYTFRGECHIGYGHRTSCSNTDVMTPASALQLLQADMSGVQGELMQALSFYSSLPPAAKTVLLDMGLNMGLTNLLEFENMLGHMELGNWWGAMMEIEDSLYYTQVEVRANANIELLFELLQEEEQMYEPDYTVF